MSLLGSIFMAGLSALNPGLGMLATLLNYITDEKASGAQALLSLAAGGIQWPSSEPLSSGLFSFASDLAIDMAFDIVDGSGQAARYTCDYCRHRPAMKVVDSTGQRVCSNCFNEVSQRILVPGNNFNSTRFLNDNSAILLNLNSEVLKSEPRRVYVVPPITLLRGEINRGVVRGGRLNRGNIEQGRINPGKINTGKLD